LVVQLAAYGFLMQMATGVGWGCTTLVRPHLGAKMLAREFAVTLPKPLRWAKTRFGENGHFVTVMTGRRSVLCGIAQSFYWASDTPEEGNR
jgi:hypothetical protein